MGKIKEALWFFTTNDKYELIISPVFDSSKELAEWANDSGYGEFTGKRIKEKFYRDSKLGAPKQRNYKVMRTELEDDE